MHLMNFIKIILIQTSGYSCIVKESLFFVFFHIYLQEFKKNLIWNFFETNNNNNNKQTEKKEINPNSWRKYCILFSVPNKKQQKEQKVKNTE